MSTTNNLLVRKSFYSSPAYKGFVVGHPSNEDHLSFVARFNSNLDISDTFSLILEENSLPGQGTERVFMGRNSVYALIDSSERVLINDVDLRGENGRVEVPVDYFRVVKVRSMPATHKIPDELGILLRSQGYQLVQEGSPIYESIGKKRILV